MVADHLRVELPATEPEARTILPDVEWGVARASLLRRGDRRMEAESYLSDGYGIRLAIMARSTGWEPMSQVARVWQPSRLKGITVAETDGIGFLSAGQSFEAHPSPRKWLSLDRTPDAGLRFVDDGDILLSCSGSVGRVLLASRPHEDRIITHDLLRIDPKNEAERGWLYAFMRTGTFRAMATGAKYGHMIKHLEPSHVDALPVLTIDDKTRGWFTDQFNRLIGARQRAYELVDEGHALYAEAANVDLAKVNEDMPFETPSSSLLRGRRRLDAAHWSPVAQAIIDGLSSSAEHLVPLPDVCARIWWPGRFRRVFGPNGTPYVSAVELFDTNGPITKLIFAGLVPNAQDYAVEPGWLLMARSGQTYGLNGRLFLTAERHRQYFVSEDLIRIIPREEVIRPGYLLAVLGHPELGRPLVLRHAYGTSIPHLEPADLEGIQVPRFSAPIEGAIADRLEESARLFAEADSIEDEMTVAAERFAAAFFRGEVGE